MPPKPLVLGFDTSAAHCAAALLSGEHILAQTLVPMKKGQAENLVPILEDVLKTAEKTWHDLSAIGVGTGPGNFTGIRISVACARGMALSLGIPAIGVTTLDALTQGEDHPTYAVVPARREMFYVQENGGAAHPIEQLSLEETRLRTTGQKVVGPFDQTDFPQSQTPMAVAIARIAMQRMTTHSKSERPAPFYIRSADAAPAKDAPPRILD